MANICRKQFEDLIDSIYDIENGVARWSSIAEQLAKSASADSAVLFRLNHGDCPPLTYGSSLELNVAAEKAYVEHYYAIDEFAWYFTHCALPSHKQYTIHKTLGKKGISKSEWYNDFFLPQGYKHLGAIMLDSNEADEGRLSFAYMREEGSSDFKTADTNLVINLAHHIDRAISLEEELGKHRHTISTLLQSFDKLTFGVLLYNGLGKVVEANDAALSMVDRNDGLVFKQNVLSTLDSSYKDALESFIEKSIRAKNGAFPGIQVMKVPRREPHSHYNLVVLPNTRNRLISHYSSVVATMFIFDNSPIKGNIADWMRSLYNLSNSESELISSLLMGLTLNEHAERRGITKNTARSTLKQIFTKTNSSSQNQLIECVLRSPIGILRPGDN